MTAPGLHQGISLSDYLALDALGSTQLGWLAVSPLEYRYRSNQPPEQTDALRLGSAVHVAALEPQRFEQVYAGEPDPARIGGAKPRATKAYRDAVGDIEASGRIVLKNDAMTSVIRMALAVREHPHAAALLRRATEREVTVIWEREDGRRCRGRLDILGDDIAGDLKTTRSLKDFSPWVITREGYYRQASWYVDGLRRCGRHARAFFLIAVESSPPHDVGVFVFSQANLEIGQLECEHLVERLAECERADRWPGMFPGVVEAEIAESVAGQIIALEEAAS